MRATAVAIVALGIATPAAAQFGGLKKKLKAAAAPEATKPAAEEVETAEAPAGAGADASTIVLGPALGRVPFGLTSPEMAAVMGALGARQALLLDGGISGQLLVREADGAARVWPGTRSVPMGLVGRVRP